MQVKWVLIRINVDSLTTKVMKMLSSFSCLYIISLAVASANHQECGADHDSQACDSDSKDGPNESGIASCKI